MNMNKNVLEHMDKAAYIILLCIAAVAVLVSMVTGPLGYKSLSIGAAVSRHHCRRAPLAHAPRRRTEIQTIKFSAQQKPRNYRTNRFCGAFCLWFK